MHLSLNLALKSDAFFTYVLTDRALDLGNLAPLTIPDLSGNANTATQYSGIYVTTNGTTDKAIVADATAAGSGNYYLTGKIKPAGTTAKTTMDGSTASNLTGLTAGVWQDFQTATASAITPSSINLGWDGTAFNATVDNWSDVKLHDASDDSVVAHWKLIDSADASLDGYPVLDSSGNGYNGAHTGCAGGSGEPDILQTAGLDFNKYFTGFKNMPISTVNVHRIKYRFYVLTPIDKNAGAGNFGQVGVNGVDRAVFLGSSTGLLTDEVITAAQLDGGLNRRTAVQNITIAAGWHTIELLWNSGASRYDILLDDVIQTVIASADGHVQRFTFSAANALLIGAISNKWLLDYIEVYDSSDVLEHKYIASTNLDQVGSIALTTNTDTLYFIPASDATPTLDALGNAITNPRPNERVANLDATDAQVTITDDASLDSLNVWAQWFFYDGNDGDIIDLSNGGGTVTIDSTSGNLVATGLTSPTYYVGNKTTAMANTAALSAGWNYIAVTFTDFSPTADLQLLRTGGHFIAYDATKTLANLEKNRAATKGQY